MLEDRFEFVGAPDTTQNLFDVSCPVQQQQRDMRNPVARGIGCPLGRKHADDQVQGLCPFHASKGTSCVPLKLGTHGTGGVVNLDDRALPIPDPPQILLGRGRPNPGYDPDTGPPPSASAPRLPYPASLRISRREDVVLAAAALTAAALPLRLDVAAGRFDFFMISTR